MGLAHHAPLPDTNRHDVSKIAGLLSRKSAVILQQHRVGGLPLIVLQLDLGNGFHELNTVACQKGGTELSAEALATLGKTKLYASIMGDNSPYLKKAKKTESAIKLLIKVLKEDAALSALNGNVKFSFQAARSIVAWDVPSNQVATVDTLAVQVWTREFLEPTLSAFPLDKK